MLPVYVNADKSPIHEDRLNRVLEFIEAFPELITSDENEFYRRLDHYIVEDFIT